MALTDALGDLIDVRLLPGRIHDPGGTADLINRLTRGQFLADRAFDANLPRDTLTRAELETVISPRSNRRVPADFDCDIYNWRHLIEDFFSKLKKYKGIAMRCGKTDATFNAFVCLAANAIRLRGTSTHPAEVLLSLFGRCGFCSFRAHGRGRLARCCFEFTNLFNSDHWHNCVRTGCIWYRALCAFQQHRHAGYHCLGRYHITLCLFQKDLTKPCLGSKPTERI
ncbi:MAG: transposase [Paracoccaceae bacterium]|jgi:transposase